MWPTPYLPKKEKEKKGREESKHPRQEESLLTSTLTYQHHRSTTISLATMSDADGTRQATVLISTAIVSVFSGFLLGVYAIRGYLISPELEKERMANYVDPVESEESDVDEEDTILDHAPNWSNGEAADRRDGLRLGALGGKVERTAELNEECKLVLVVRTDLGMTKGQWHLLRPFMCRPPKSLPNHS